MKLQPFYVFYVLILFIVSACKPSGYTSSVACDDFPEVEILTKDSVKINEILIPVWMSVCDDKAVVHSMKTDDVFFVYGLPEFKFLYKTGVRGEGPDDFGFVQKIQSADGDGTGIPVTEFTNGCTSALVFGGGSVTRTDVEKLRHFPMALRIDDSLGVICTIKKLKVVNTFSGQTVDSVVSTQTIVENVETKWEKSVYKTGSQSYNRSVMSTVRNGLVATAFGRTVVLGYTGMDRLEFYGADDAGKLTVRSVYGADSVFSAEKDVVRGYMELIPTKDYLFARYMERDKKGYAGIRIFTWDGRPVKQFLLEGRCHFYEIDVRRNTIYAIDQNADFEYVYRYRYSI